MARSRAPATVRRYVASIASAHRADGHGETLRDPTVRLALKRMQGRQRDRRESTEGLTWQRCQQLMKAAGDRLIDIRNRALLAVAYDAMLGRSGLTALQVTDVLDARPDGAALLVRSGESDGNAQGERVRIAPDTARLLRAWLSESGISEGYLFRSVTKNGRPGGALPPGQVTRIFRMMAGEAKLPDAVSRRLSGDSPRIGAVQDFVAAGIDLPAILQVGPRLSGAASDGRGNEPPGRRSGAVSLVRLLRRAQARGG